MFGSGLLSMAGVSVATTMAIISLCIVIEYIAVIVDNRFHRIHHSLDEKHFDKNFGIAMSLWDWIFGTAHWPSKDEWPKVGVAGVDQPRNVVDFLALPWRIWRSDQPSVTPPRMGNDGGTLLPAPTKHQQRLL